MPTTAFIARGSKVTSIKNLRIAYGDEPFNRGLDDDSLQHGSISVDGLTFEGGPSAGMPGIQISDDNLSGSAESTSAA